MSERGAGFNSPTPPPTNTLAIISLVMAIAGVLIPVMGAVTAVVTGQVALDQIRRTGEGGTHMAYWGVALGWVVIGLWVVVAIVVVFLVLIAQFIGTGALGH